MNEWKSDLTMTSFLPSFFCSCLFSPTVDGAHKEKSQTILPYKCILTYLSAKNAQDKQVSASTVWPVWGTEAFVIKIAVQGRRVSPAATSPTLAMDVVGSGS